MKVSFIPQPQWKVQLFPAGSPPPSYKKTFGALMWTRWGWCTAKKSSARAQGFFSSLTVPHKCWTGGSQYCEVKVKKSQTTSIWALTVWKLTNHASTEQIIREAVKDKEMEARENRREKNSLSVFFQSFQLLSYPPEVTTRNTIFHGETILTVGDGSLHTRIRQLSLSLAFLTQWGTGKMPGGGVKTERSCGHVRFRCAQVRNNSEEEHG